MPSQDPASTSDVDESHTAIALPSTFTQCSSWSLRSSRDRAFQEGIQPSHVPSSSSTPTKLLGETPHSGHEQHYDMVNQRLLADSEYISPDEKKVTQHCESDKSTTPMTDLGAQTPSITSGVTRCQGGTTASASLLPNVIAEALNSRSMNASSLSCSTNTPAFIQPIPKSHASASDVYSSNCSKMGHFIDHEQISRNMGFNMNHSTTSTGNGHPNSRDQSDNPKNALTQPSLIIGNNEMSQMTHQDDSKSADPKASSLLFGSTFNTAAYGKPNRLQQDLQGHTSRQGSSTLPIPLKEVSTTDAELTQSNAVLKSSNLQENDASYPIPACQSATVLPEYTSMTNSPNSTMGVDKSRTDKNAASERAPWRKSKRRMEENLKPKTADVAVTTPTNPPETQGQKLERLQKQHMTKLGHKIRQQCNEPTTSPQALSIARQASSKLQPSEVISEIPKTITIALSPTSTADVNGAKKGNAPINGLNVQAKVHVPRQEPKDRSMRSSNISTRERRGGRYYDGKRTRWATTAELKPTPALPKSIDSNAFGSEAPTDVETASGDSVAPMNNGRQLRKNRPAGPDTSLADWSGNWMPPPADWDDRPRFNNNCAAFVGEFGSWNESTAAQSINVTTGIPFTRLSKDLVENPDLHPDGLNLIDPMTSVNADNAEQYGYSGDALISIKQDAQPIEQGSFDDDWGKLDLRNADNQKFQNECCKDLVRNYNADIAKARDAEISLKRAQKLARKREGPIIPTPNPHTPRINIYLRPAVRSDIPQLRDIYNSYVKNSVRPTELQTITYDNMLNRWTDCIDEKLPFIVAVSKSAKINRSVDNAIEKIVGWASATDWVSRHSVERFTVELEIYVHQKHLHQGVGKCLMDKLIDSTDRGHIARKGYPFTCAPEVRHGYSAGGTRDLIKLLILVRTLDKPKNAKENELPWIKKWLEEQWNFEQQGHVPGAGVKFKRYITSTTFVRSTSYTPKEGMIPEESH